MDSGKLSDRYWQKVEAIKGIQGENRAEEKVAERFCCSRAGPHLRGQGELERKRF